MVRKSFIVALAILAACDSTTGPGIGDFSPLARCEGGAADGYPCDGVDLVGFLPRTELGSGVGVPRLNDLWGWTDPSTDRNYGLVGRTDGVVFVDVTDPTEPRSIGFLASRTGVSTWRDIKVYDDHAFIVADGIPGHGMQVFDLTRLRGVDEFQTFNADLVYDRVSAVHNIAINEETGFAYAVGSNSGGDTCGGGLHMIDVRSPRGPTFAGCYARTGTGRAGTGYTHDVQCVMYDGPDTEHRGREICIASNETAVVIVDVTDKSSPIFLSAASYPGAAYVHQGWLTEDQAYFLQNDELDEATGVVANTRLLVWDVRDLDDPRLAREILGSTNAIDHNLYVRGDRAYWSSYTAGLRVLDVADGGNPAERWFFDTVPTSDNPKSFDGSWSNYPWFDNGIILVSSAQEGLFILQLQR